MEAVFLLEFLFQHDILIDKAASLLAQDMVHVQREEQCVGYKGEKFDTGIIVALGSVWKPGGENSQGRLAPQNGQADKCALTVYPGWFDAQTFPKIRLLGDPGDDYRLSRTGDAAKNAFLDDQLSGKRKRFPDHARFQDKYFFLFVYTVYGAPGKGKGAVEALEHRLKRFQGMGMPVHLLMNFQQKRKPGVSVFDVRHVSAPFSEKQAKKEIGRDPTKT
jgi:hypothetical protein